MRLRFWFAGGDRRNRQMSVRSYSTERTIGQGATEVLPLLRSHVDAERRGGQGGAREHTWACDRVTLPRDASIRAAWQSKKNGTPGAIRTRDLLLRRQTLYPTELRVPNAYGCLIYYAANVFSREFLRRGAPMRRFFSGKNAGEVDKNRQRWYVMRKLDISRRGSQEVRQRSAKSLRPVRFRSTPPFFLPSFRSRAASFRLTAAWAGRAGCPPFRTSASASASQGSPFGRRRPEIR